MGELKVHGLVNKSDTISTLVCVTQNDQLVKNVEERNKQKSYVLPFSFSIFHPKGDPLAVIYVQ